MSLLSQFSLLAEQHLNKVLDALTEPSEDTPTSIDEARTKRGAVHSKLTALRDEQRRLITIGAELIDQAAPHIQPAHRIPMGFSGELLFVGRFGVIDSHQVQPELLSKIRNLSAKHDRLNLRAKELEVVESNLAKLIIAMGRARLAKDRENKGQAGNTQIQSKDVPQRILLPGRSASIDVPYWSNLKDDGSEYAGDPMFYNFGGKHEATFSALRKILADNNIPDFNVCYANSRTGGRSKTTSHRQFLVMTPDKKVAWRRNGIDEGAQNNVYLNGTIIKTSTLINMSPQDVTKLLQQSGVIK